MSPLPKQAIKSTPAYLQIEHRLRGEINRGIWPAGSMLPSRRDLAKEYGVSSLTVDRAVTRLIAEGILRADDRRGTFVTSSSAQEGLAAPLDRSAASLESYAVVRSDPANADYRVAACQPYRPRRA
jgi:DNA-binding GntR family transcriptional regulator